MKIQVNIRAEKYWSMTGRVVAKTEEGVLVRLFGYVNPILFKATDLEPLEDGSDLESWLDSLLVVKEYQ